MRLLFDTHTFLWYLTDYENLTKDTQAALRDLDNEVYVSVVTDWEIVIKYQIGRLALPKPPELFLPEQHELYGFKSLEVNRSSILRLTNLPLIHRDPFDRLLIAQALEYDLTLVTVDENLKRYPVKLL
jgi:PIN domain nuclease of toxin-antitoxin system